jgi:hypothetical protein
VGVQQSCGFYLGQKLLDFSQADLSACQEKKAAGGEQEKGEHIGPRNFRKASESENEIENARCDSAGGNVFRQNFSFSLCIGFESFLHATFSFN